jgi:hypothetical protein
VLLALLFLPVPTTSLVPSAARFVAGPFAGLRVPRSALSLQGPPLDFAQDVLGARGLLRRGAAYPILAAGARAEWGLEWGVEHRSTHPPTAFLFALPFAALAWEGAAALWTGAMLGALAGSCLALGLPWRRTVVLLPVLLLWPPAAASLGQLTALWLLGLVLAWRWREAPFRAGAAIALASLPKLVPALALLPFLWRRQWPALVGFGAVWLAALTVLGVVSPGVFVEYATLGWGVAAEQARRPDNGALFVVAWREGSWVAGTLAAAAVGGALWLAVQRSRRGGPVAPHAWALWVWVGVALLPIAWNYSLLPLAPWLGRVVRHGSPAARLVAGAAVLVPMVVPPVTAWLAALSVATGIALAGGAFLLDATERGALPPEVR